MATKAKRHIHKYHLVEMNSQKVWACALGDCNHYMPSHMSKMVPGKSSICWGCNNEMTLGPDNMQDDMPKCNKCNHPELAFLEDVI